MKTTITYTAVHTDNVNSNNSISNSNSNSDDGNVNTTVPTHTNTWHTASHTTTSNAYMKSNSYVYMIYEANFILIVVLHIKVRYIVAHIQSHIIIITWR